jgi:putative Mg2+ transporter-C (MgtC) family protein
MAALRADLLVLARLLLAAALGGVLGWERHRAGKWAGPRTLMLVGVASALFVGASGLAAMEASHLPGDFRADPIRAVQAVAIGIGFLGAGIVHVDREGGVRGLTTSAAVWAAAGMGVTVALGRYALAVGTTVLLLAILRIARRLERDAGE